MVYLIGIAGGMGAGKTTLGNTLYTMFKGAGISVGDIHLADALKLEYHWEYFGKHAKVSLSSKEQLAYVNANKDVARPHLQRLGMEMRKKYGEDIWLNKVRHLGSLSYKVVIVPDVRFDNEAKGMDYLIQLDVPLEVRSSRVNIINGGHESENGITVLADLLLQQWSYPKVSK